MNTFPVWLGASGNSCRVRVDGIKNVQWLINRLGHSFVFKTAEPMNEDVGSSCYTFRVAYSSQISPRGFARLLAAIPEVNLMTEPV
jgi:hypothetical protein